MQKILPIAMLAISAITLLGGSLNMAALAASNPMATTQASSKSNITINVTCNDNTKQTKHLQSTSNTVANVNVNCGGTGGGTVGPKGDKGDTGPQGIPGTQGENGPPGVQGKQGDIGLTGITGAQGEKGDTGATGPAGTNGTNATICIVVGNETCGLTPTNTTQPHSILPPMTK